MITNNCTSKRSPFHGLTPEARTRIENKLTAIEASIQGYTDNETKEVTKLFETLESFVTAIKGSLHREANTTTTKQTEQHHPAVVAVNSWLSSMPQQFPDYMPFDPTQKIRFKTPFIGDEPEDTQRAVRNGLAFLLEVAIPWPGTKIFRLGEEATRGYVDFILTLQDAMEFELVHRREGGIPTELDDVEETA